MLPISTVSVGVLCALLATPLYAQDYPSKPVRIVVGFAVGSTSDLLARIIGQKLGTMLNQPFVVEVRPGAGSNVAAQSVVRSPKDGYTLLIATSSSTIRSAGQASFSFDFSADLAPIAPIANVPFVLTANPGLGVKSVGEFVALAKARPETVTLGATAVGTTAYLASQLLNQQAGLNLVIAPYPSSAQATTDLITGRISAMFASVPNVLQLIEEGKLTALAVGQAWRSEMIPNVPTIDEACLPGVDASIWIGLLAPAGTPPAIVALLSKAVNEALRSEEVLGQMASQGMEPLGGTPDEFAMRIKRDTARWDEITQTSGLQK
jgi:tripartite-type tricarboxylate transporter receptor subunit TctC